MNTIKKILILALGYFSFMSTYAQSPVGVNGIPSPNVASLGVIHEVPVSLYTGKCDIKIPIYELKENDITVPIYLFYNSSGIKPDVHPGWVGLNWGLQAGGMITRTVKGIPDEAAWQNSILFFDSYNSTFKLGETPGYLYNYANNNILDWSSSNNVLNKAKSEQWVDTEPDQFTFNINGITGTFYIGEDGKIYCHSSPGIKIEMGDLMQIDFPSYLVSPAIANINGLYTNNVDIKVTGFKITMPDGMQYEFGYYGVNQSDDPFLVEASVNFFNELYYGENWNTWLLQKIKSPNGACVTFHYEPGTSQITNGVSYLHPISSFYRTTSLEKINGSATPKGIFKLFGPVSAHSLSIYNKYDGDIIYSPYLSYIETPSQKIDFSISKTQELRYNYGAISTDLLFQADSYSQRLHCFSPRFNLAPYYVSDVDAYIERPDLNPLYWYMNSALVYNYIANYLYPNSYELIASNGVMYEALDFDLFQWFKLDQISLYSKAESKYLKKWNFGYNNNSNARLMLLSLQEIGENNETKNPYAFEYEDYNGINKYSGTYTLPGYNSSYLDHWGYYNGINSHITSFTTANMNAYYNQRNANASYLYTGQLNKINYPLGGSVEFTYEPNQFSKTIKRNTSTGNFETQNHSTPVTGGGSRIKNIKYKEGDEIRMQKDYTYSEGIMGHEIKYYWPNYKGKLQSNPNATYTRERFVSQNLLPLCGGLDYSISYPKVEEIVSGSGKTEYYYSNHLTNPDENFINTIDVEKSISSPFSSKDFERGKLLRKIIKDENGVVKKKENYTYAKNENVAKDYIPAVATKQFPVIDGWAIEGASYKQYIYPYSLTTSIDSVYDINAQNPVVTVTDYGYNANNLVKTITHKNSDGKEFMTRYKYIGDYNLALPANPPNADKSTISFMVRRKNMIGCLAEEQLLMKREGEWNLLKGKLIRYGCYNINNQNEVYKPREEWLLETSTPLTDITESELMEPGFFVFNNYYKKRIAYNSYDTYGNSTSITKDDIDNVVYLWSYNHQHPIAEIKNADYQQVKDVLSETVINRIANAATPAASDLTLLNNLRSNPNLQKAEITTYEYKPLVGMTSMTDPRGLKTTYEYDAFGRLQTVKDPNGNKLEGYDYHYKNP